MTPKSPHHYNLLPGPLHPPFPLKSPFHSKFFHPCSHFIFWIYLPKFLKTQIQNWLCFCKNLKIQPFTLPKLKNKIKLKFARTKKETTIIKPKLCHSSAFFTGSTLLKTLSFSLVIHNWHFSFNSHSTLLAWLGPLFHQSLPFLCIASMTPWMSHIHHNMCVLS